jgi:hypothetical protein
MWFKCNRGGGGSQLYVTIRPWRQIYNKGNEQATPYVWARFAVYTEIITVTYGKHLIYEKNTSLKTAEENYTTTGQLQRQYIFLMNQKYAHKLHTFHFSLFSTFKTHIKF